MKKNSKNILFLLNSVGGGASKGIYEFIESSDDSMNFYAIVPNKPLNAQLQYYEKYFTNWLVLPLNFWSKKRKMSMWSRIRFSVYQNKRSLFRILDIIRIIRYIKSNRIDIVYTGTVLNLEGALAAKLTGKPHIWHIKETFGSKGRIKFFLPDWILSRVILFLSENVLVMTDYIRSFLGSKYPDEKVITIYDGVRSSLFQNYVDLKEKWGFENKLVIGVIASLSSDWKNHWLALNVCKQVCAENKDVRFAFLGEIPKHSTRDEYNGPYKYYQSLLEFADENNLNDLIYWGCEESVPDIMNSIDILFHPCETEPFGRIIIEAMAASKPILGPASGGVGETVEDGITGFLVPPGNVKEFAEKLTILIQNENMRNEMGKAGLETVTGTQYDQRNHNSKMKEILNRLMN